MRVRLFVTTFVWYRRKEEEERAKQMKNEEEERARKEEEGRREKEEEEKALKIRIREAEETKAREEERERKAREAEENGEEKQNFNQLEKAPPSLPPKKSAAPTTTERESFINVKLNKVPDSRQSTRRLVPSPEPTLPRHHNSLSSAKPSTEMASPDQSRNRTASFGYFRNEAVGEIPRIPPTPPEKDVKVNNFYSYEELKEMKALKQYPDDVVPALLHLYLSDDEFKVVLGCPRSEWNSLPKWKQKQKKVDARIF